MAIDYLTRLRQAEQKTGGMVQGRSVEDELSRTASNIDATRGKFLEGVGSRIGGITGIGPSYSQKLPEADRSIQAKLARQKYDMQRSQYSVVFEDLYNRALAAGLDEQTAIAYARDVADQQMNMDYLAGEAEKDRTAKRSLNDLQNEYARKGVELQDEYSPKPDYTSALLSVLLGGAAQYGTAKYQSGRLLNGTQKTTPATGYNAKLQDYFANQDAVSPYLQGYGVRGYSGSYKPKNLFPQAVGKFSV